jgi:peptide/nickel transport system substrate-binding protein
VRPEDFRWALERTLRIRGSYAGLYANIVGAGACLERPARCDLSRGVVADRASYTVTFHLVRPDPDLLYKLTLPAAYAVPDGVGPSFVSSEPVPATGPYVIERHAPGDELVLARNPNFHEWSPEAQPDGYPDRIVYKFGYTDRSVVSAIGADRADWGIYRFPFAPPGPLVEQLSARHASQVHVNPLNEVQWFVLRVNAPPFDKVEVRRAVNLAVDRNRIVELIGGPAVGTPTCQILPPGIPGHTPYCPYTEAPSDDGRYIGPRLAEARRLVAASGARGTRVIVATEPDNPVADYLVSVLRSIGLDAHPRVTHDPATRYARDVGVSDEGWVADYPSPTEFLPLLLSCQPDGTSAGGGFCSRALDQAMDDAQDTMMRNPAKGAQKWAELDRRFTDLAVWVPTVNLNAVGYVSTRTHNYQFHPQWGLMVDQLWLDRH